MQKIVINRCYGGFGLSSKARELLQRYMGTDTLPSRYVFYSGSRDNPHLVRVVEELEQEAGYKHADLRVVEVPDGVKWFIVEYDGLEHVAEEHRTWQ